MSDQDDAFADAVNKRASLRRRTIFGGVVYTDDGRQWDCSVSDISATGVRVRLPELLDHGTLVDLKINKFNDLRRCEVVWVRDPYLGLKFLVEIPENDKNMTTLFKLGPKS